MTQTRLAQLPHDAVPEPAVSLSGERVLGAATRRRRATRARAVGGASMALVALAVVGFSLLPVAGSASGSHARRIRRQPGPSPRGSTELYDPYDFVRAGESTFLARGEPPAGTRLGVMGLTIRCQLSKGAPEAGYQLRSGDAAFLPVGAQLREVIRFDPAFRLAAVVGDRIRFYELDRPNAPVTGEDAFPGFRQHISSIVVLNRHDGKTETGRISGRDQVSALARQLVAAPYVPSAATETARRIATDGQRVDKIRCVRGPDKRRAHERAFVDLCKWAIVVSNH